MIYTFGLYALDTDRCELRRAGVPRPLEPHALDILAYLLQHRDRVVTKRELLEQLWPDRFVNEGILGAAQRGKIEPRRGHEFTRIHVAAVR